MIADRLFAFADHFVPKDVIDPEELRVLRTAVLLGWLGFAFTGVFGPIYWYLESPISGALIVALNLLLLWSIFAIRRGTSVSMILHVSTALAWLMSFVVAWRTGGFTSPALVWNFVYPLTTYLIRGRRASAFWSTACVLQILFFYVAELGGLSFNQAASEGALRVLRLSGYAGLVGTMLALIALIERIRATSADALVQASRVLEAERILQDMHDGVGNQLLGLLMELRHGQVPTSRLVAGLQGALDDLRLIVDSLDSSERSLEVALAELRAMLEPRCQSGAVRLRWSVSLPSQLVLSAATTLQLLRMLHELVSNATKHARTESIDVVVRAAEDVPGFLDVSVRDFGVGFDAEAPPRSGRGLNNIRQRARRMRASVSFTRATPGTHVLVRIPAE